MARKAATRKAAPAAKPADTKPQDTQGAEDSLKGAHAPDQAEATQAGGVEPPASNLPPAEPAPAAEVSLAEVMSAVVPMPLTAVPTSVKAVSEPKPEQGVLAVTGPRRGRWRAGWHFGPEPRRIPLAGLTDEERAAIEGDPALKAAVEPEA